MNDMNNEIYEVCWLQKTRPISVKYGSEFTEIITVSNEAAVALQDSILWHIGVTANASDNKVTVSAQDYKFYRQCDVPSDREF